MITPWTDASALPDIPRGSELRTVYPQNWVRFYTLDGGERIARTDGQRAEQMRRYLSVLDALGEPVLLVTATELVPAAPYGDRFASHIGNAEDLVPLLELVADDRAWDVVIAPADLRWLVHPYDGGIDVVGEHGLGDQFGQWRSPRADGL